MKLTHPAGLREPREKRGQAVEIDQVHGHAEQPAGKRRHSDARIEAERRYDHRQQPVIQFVTVNVA
jgi:hypothetical protein